MSGVTKLGLALILIFIFSLLGFSAELLYVLWYQRKFRRGSPAGGDPELSASGEEDTFGSLSSKDLLLSVLCCKKNHSRVEPAAAAATVSPLTLAAKPLPEATEECELARWRAMCFGPSRVLYTIREEEELDGEKEVGGISGSGDGGSDVAEAVEEEEEEGMLFSTPCASPPFYTPASSPPRAAERV